MSESLLHQKLTPLVQKLKQLQAQRQVILRYKKLELVQFLPSQKKYLDAIQDPNLKIILLTGANQVGKSFVTACDLSAEILGHEPWSGRPRPQTDYNVALLLEDFDSHAAKFLDQNILDLWPRDLLRIVRTSTGAPRIITFPNGRKIHIFTREQDPGKLEGATWQRVHVDEPNSRSHVIALIRGLQKTSGKLTMTMTPTSDPWIFEEYYQRAGNLGGDRTDVHAITAWPDENKISHGGHLPDEDVEAFRANLTQEEREARVHGRWMHVIGRIYKDFDDRVHVIEQDLVDDPNTCPWILVCDPHDRLPFFMLWAYITPDERLVIRHEWPEEPFEDIHSTSMVYEDYVEIIRTRPRALHQLMDPNFGQRRSASTGRTVRQEIAMLSTPDCPLYFRTDLNDDLAFGHKEVQRRLRWDTERPLSAVNQPRLLVHKSCRNVVHGFHNYVWDNWRGRVSDRRERKQKPVEKFKHAMDCVRYLCVYPLKFQNLYENSQIMAYQEMRPGWQKASPRRRSLGRL